MEQSELVTLANTFLESRCACVARAAIRCAAPAARNRLSNKTKQKADRYRVWRTDSGRLAQQSVFTQQWPVGPLPRCGSHLRLRGREGRLSLPGEVGADILFSAMLVVVGGGRLADAAELQPRRMSSTIEGMVCARPRLPGGSCCRTPSIGHARACDQPSPTRGTITSTCTKTAAAAAECGFRGGP